MNNQLERRSFTTNIEVRSAGGKNVLVGRAAAYNSLSADLGGFREIIAPGTFSRAVREKDDCAFLVNHDEKALPLGRVSSGTLQLTEDQNGLNCRCDLPNTQAAHDLVESINRNDIREMSFAFAIPAGGDEWSDGYDENGIKYPLRTLREVRPLFDVSAVLRPAYPSGTSLSALATQNISSLQVSATALMEARSRGGYVPRPRIVVPAPRFSSDPFIGDLQRREEAKRNSEKFYTEEHGHPRMTPGQRRGTGK
ncbi:MAG TPA: HK97 family phage prohead protease [Candidatus Acidoferrales bacterium]|nr:HK97 family phage prohead protease [Candidatus Acidoferrales bacterium]